MLLEKADFEKEFQLYYQPQYDISGEVLIGAEALLRWNSPEIGMIAPGEFIPIAEDTGIIIKLGEWSIKKAINQIITWNENYDSKMRISINLSLAQFKDTAFMNKLITFLRDNNVCPEWVDIEIAEGIAMKGNKEFADIFNRISEMGFSISIDNFGANYSSLNYLENFSVNRIKIAQQLVDDVDKDNSKAKIVKAVVSMAKSLGLIVTAVGVECIEQLEVLKDFECDEIQGRLFGYPLPVSEFEKIYF
jgi:EAL domain-containing protein (putative c-di-GMP-specific phosphodiesterase class I)